MVAPQSLALELRSKFFLFPIEREVLYGFARVWDPNVRLRSENEEDFLSELDCEVQRGNYVNAARLALRQNLLEILIEGGKIKKEAGFVWDLPHLGLRFPDLRKRFPDSDDFTDEVFRHSDLIDGYLMDEAASLSDLEPMTFNQEGIKNLRQQLPTRFLERYDEHNPKSVLVYSLEPFVEDDDRGKSAVRKPVEKKAVRAVPAAKIIVAAQSQDEDKPAGEEKRVLRRRHGKHLLERVAQTVNANPIGNLIQLFCNSFDADATRIDFSYDRQTSRCIVEDDGLGMDLDELDLFLLSGDSNKPGTRTPKFNRAPLGRFGLAAINLRNLARGYRLETTKEGVDRKIIVEEIFGDKEPLYEGKLVHHHFEDALEDDYGTRIIMDGLRFPDLNVKRLANEVRWRMPIDAPSFEVYIDERKVEPPIVRGLASFLYRLHGKHMGDVEAVMHLTGNAHERAGLHVKVFGMTIGEPGDLVDYGNRPLRFRKRHIGIIRADGLDGAIMIDRGRFDEQHPAFIELREAMEPVLSDVSNYARAHFEDTSVSRVLASRNAALRFTRERLVGSKIVPRGYQVELASPDGEKGFNDEVVGIVRGKRVLLNENQPALRISEKMGPAAQKSDMLNAAVVAIVIQQVGREASVAEFMHVYNEIWNRVRPEIVVASSDEGEKDVSHPHLLYPSSRVLKDMGIDSPDLRYLRSKKVLDSTGDLLLGSDVHGVQRRMGLYTVSLRRIVQEHHHSAKDIQNEQIFEGRLRRAGNAIEPFFVNLNKETGKPSCYFTMPLCVGPLNSLFVSAVFRRKTSDRLRHAFEEFGAEAYTPDELVEYTHLVRDEVDAVIRGAELRGSPLERLSGKGRGVSRYRFKDFVGAYQHHAQIKAQEN